MKTSRLLIHEDSCPDKKSKFLKMCPYNPIHKMNPESYENHKMICPQRPIVDKAIEKELKEYLASNKSTINYSNTGISTIKRESNEGNVVNNSNLDHAQHISKEKQKISNINSKTVGVRNDILDKNSKKEKKKEQKKMLQLIEGNFEDSMVLPSKDQENALDKLEEEFERDFYENQNRNQQKLQLNDVNNYYDSGFYEDDNDTGGMNNYDPNESDLHIDPKNKNYINPNDLSEFNKIPIKTDKYSFSQNKMETQNNDTYNQIYRDK